MELLRHVKSTAAGDFFSPAGYFFLGWVVFYVLVGAFFSFLEQRKNKDGQFSLAQALKFGFPRKTFWGDSAKLDYKIFLFNHYFIFYLAGLVLLVSQDKVAALIAPHVSNGVQFFGGFHVPITNGFWLDLIYTVLVLFVADLGWTIQHILFHKVSRLWEFHKVHHSAKELNIFTIARLHPIDALSQAWAAGICIGILMGLSKVLLGYTPSLVLFMNVSWAMAFFRIFGIYRHSHIWISFNPKLSHFVSSPAMHQIHHSIEERHLDKNFAVVFSFWDLVFRTLYIPKEKEAFGIGIQIDEADPRKYDSFFGSMLHPFLSDGLLNRYYRRSQRNSIGAGEVHEH